MNNLATKYISKYFKLHELVPKEYYIKYGESQLLWGLFDPRILYTIDLLKEYYNKSFIINDYKYGGNNQYRGWRPYLDWVEYCNKNNIKISYFSQHLFGRAIDFIIKGVKVEEVNNHILQNQDKYKYITFIEIGKTWTHIDCRNSIFNGIHSFTN